MPMKWIDRGLLIVLFCLAALGRVAAAEEEGVLLDNGTTRAEIQLVGGVLRHWGDLRAENLLWRPSERFFEEERNRGWLNYGGEKIYAANQCFWPQAYDGNVWPPEQLLLKKAWEVVAQAERSVTLKSPESPKLGAVLERTVTLATDQPRLTLTQTITRTRLNPYPVCLWNVAQIPIPAYFLVDIAVDRPLVRTHFRYDRPWEPYQAGTFRMVTAKTGKLMVNADSAECKFTAYGRKIGVVTKSGLLILASDFNPVGCYADGGNLEIFAARLLDDGYSEIEFLSETRFLAPGEMLSSTVCWTLLPLSAEASEETVIQLFESTELL